MIDSKYKLREYLKRDNYGFGARPWWYRLIKRIGGMENYRMYEFFRILRHYEYYKNCGLGEGYFAIYWPQDGHMPSIISDISMKVTKVIVKVMI